MGRVRFFGVRRIFKAVVSVFVLSALVLTGISYAEELGTITTIAGVKERIGYNGDEIPATQASISGSTGIALDQHNNLYIIDTYGAPGRRIRKVDSNGIIHTIAGNGSFSESTPPINVPATSTWIYYPYNVGFGPDGLIYFASKNSFLKINENNLLNMYVHSFDMYPALFEMDTKGNIYFADNPRGADWAPKIFKINWSDKAIEHIAGNRQYQYNGDNIPAIDAALGQVYGLAIDEKRNLLYISDYYQNRIRKVDLLTGIITTYAGGGNPDDKYKTGIIATQAYLLKPRGLALDKDGNLFVADFGNRVVRKIDSNPPHIITNIAGDMKTYNMVALNDGIPANEALIFPKDVAVDSDGNLLLLCEGGYATWFVGERVRKVVLVPPIPACPVSLTGEYDDGAVLTWQPPSSLSNVTYYRIYRDGVHVADIPETGMASYGYADTNVNDCTDYCYTVVAHNSTGEESKDCASACVRVPDLTPPAVPSNVTATALNGSQIMLSWGESADTCEGKASLYTIYNSNGAVSGSTSGTTFTVSGLNECTDYCFKVTASDATGNTSAPSQPACAKTPVVVSAGGDPSGKCGGTYNLGSAIPISFTITKNGLPVGPAEIGNPVPKLYFNSNGAWVEVTPTVIGSTDGLFKYVGDGEWKINLKMSLPGDYMIMAVPNAGGNTICANIVFEPVPSCNFTLVEKGKK